MTGSLPLRALGCLALLLVTASTPLVLPVAGAEAAQPWSCVCKGVKKRYLASTRHCEHQMKLPKGKWCSKEQYRAVYGPACRAQGCRLPPA